MRSYTVLASLLALLVYGVQPCDAIVFAKAGGVGANVTVVDSTGKLVGNVVGTNFGTYYVALDPSLTGGDSTLVITVNRNRLGGNSTVVFTTSDCTGTPYFLAVETLTPQTFVVAAGSSFLLYKENPASTPFTGTFFSGTTFSPDINGTRNNCFPDPGEVLVKTSDVTTIPLNLTPPFRFVNP